MKKRSKAAERELRRIALTCPDGAARKIVLQIRREHREQMGPDRALVREVRSRGGVCFPGGMSREEWRSRLARPLRGKAVRCVPPDEIAQEFFDRGSIGEPSTDVVLDHLNAAYGRARSLPPIPAGRELQRQARREVTGRVKRAVKELTETAKKEAEALCPPSTGEEKSR